jgi:hypothetical protein
MYRTNSSRFWPIVLMIIVTIALIFGMIMVGRYLFAGQTSDNTQTSKLDSARDNLLAVDADRSVAMTVRGPLVAQENFRSYEIKVSPDARSYISYKGYDDTVVSQKNFANLTVAYKEFVYALDRAEFTKPGRQTGQPDVDNVSGICATGRLYTFTLYNGSDVVNSSWTSSCSGSAGTFGANVDQVGKLFANQIPGTNLGFGSTRLSL